MTIGASEMWRQLIGHDQLEYSGVSLRCFIKPIWFDVAQFQIVSHSKNDTCCAAKIYGLARASATSVVISSTLNMPGAVLLPTIKAGVPVKPNCCAKALLKAICASTSRAHHIRFKLGHIHAQISRHFEN
jgi:hypothetical protein